MTSLIDFTAAGELEVFIDEGQVASLEKKMAEKGYLEGGEMANTFNLLRANDLIWTFVINNYLLGRDPFPFDLLHWNCDSTRMPATMHSFYLRNMYMKNLLRKPGGLTLDGVKIDLSKVAVPSYFVSAIEDHIAPWKTTYAGPQILGGKSRFVLSGSGHIAGMINPRPAPTAITMKTTSSPSRTTALKLARAASQSSRASCRRACSRNSAVSAAKAIASSWSGMTPAERRIAFRSQRMPNSNSRTPIAS